MLTFGLRGHILEVMTPRSAPRQRHLASSPFAPRPEPVIEVFAVDDRVSHDSYGMGRVVNVEAGAVTVDFGSQTVRIVSPYSKLEKF
jgi:hypothetical protein